MPPPTILFRSCSENLEEREICSQFFEVSDSRVGIPDRLVIGRYSVLPFYRELTQDLKLQNSVLVNSLMEHEYIAEFGWYHDLEELTPKTWFTLPECRDHQGPLVLKGRTNSRKHLWDEKMFAPSFERAVEIYTDLLNDPLIGTQGVVIRAFAPLRTFGHQIHGLPITNEWRVFFYKDQWLAYGYYWSGNPECVSQGENAFIDEGLPLAERASKIISRHASFFVLDVAEKEDGTWTVIEVNDGQMSGLSMVDPKELYSSLRMTLQARAVL